MKKFNKWKRKKIETTLGHKAKNIFTSFYLCYYLKNAKTITNFTT